MQKSDKSARKKRFFLNNGNFFVRMGIFHKKNDGSTPPPSLFYFIIIVVLHLNLQFVYQSLAFAVFFDNEEYVADVYVDAALKIRVEYPVGAHRF